MSWLKYIHIGCAVLSGSGYFIRGLWMLRESPWLQKKWVKVVPHIIDTILLVSAIALTVQIQQYPLTHHWLTAKVVALLAYIVLGTIGIKRGKTRQVRIAAWLAAMGIFIYIVSVALTHQVVPFA